jgi:two-component system, OmpR family, response regulator CpxR
VRFVPYGSVAREVFWRGSHGLFDGAPLRGFGARLLVNGSFPAAADGPGLKRASPPQPAGDDVLRFGAGREKLNEQEQENHNMRPKKVILCVDDNEQDLSVLKFMLVTNGYRVLAATNGQDAIALFADNQIDLVLTDHAMPQMSGDQLVLKLKQIASHVPMVILGDPQKMNGQIHGADALLAKKNCSPQELLERVKIMSARKRGPRKGVSRLVSAELAVAS